MEQKGKHFITAAEVFQSWCQQPFEERQPDSEKKFARRLEDALSFYCQGKQFACVYDFQAGKTIFVSQNVTQVLGYKPQEISPEFLYNKMHPDDHDQVLKISRAAGDLVLQNKEITAMSVFLTVDFRMLHAQSFYVKMQRQSSILLRDELGNFRFSMAVFQDISHLYRGNEVSFDLNVPEYKIKLLNILDSYNPGHGSGEFSVREKQVLRLLAQGKNTRQIAQELSLSNFTVDTHRKNMKKKLRARNTAELITAAISRRLI